MKEDIADFFQNLVLPGIDILDQKIVCPAGDILVYDRNNIIINFYYHDTTENLYKKRSNRPILIISDEIDINNVLNSKRGSSYDIQWFDYIKQILNIDNTYEKLKITKSGKKIIKKVSEKTIQIPELVFIDMTKDSYDVYKQGKSSKNRLELYLINKLKLKYTNKIPKETTTVGKGDFSFMIERFNLKSKNKKKDYERYLDLEDVKNLEYFTEKLIQDEVFSNDFLRALDEYFIKEKLQDIIIMGREILDLGKDDIYTNRAKQIISKVTDDSSDIKQLENLWQKYFEKYLLYLIFSYKKIFPKVKLTNIRGDKKYPDFIGINHYNGLDIIEIKTHLKNVVIWDASHENFCFSSELSKAVIQTMNYIDAVIQQRFQNPDDEKRITNMTEEENLYHPRGIIIISSDEKLAKGNLDKAKEECLKRDFTKLRNSLQNIEIVTFSEILQVADDYVKNIHAQYE